LEAVRLQSHLAQLTFPSRRQSNATVWLKYSRRWKAYKTVGDNVMFLQYWRSHLGVLVVIMLDESLVAHAGFLLYEDCSLDDLAEAGCVWIAGFEHHVGLRRCLLRDVLLGQKRCNHVELEAQPETCSLRRA
jgi:hypothetical protein